MIKKLRLLTVLLMIMIQYVCMWLHLQEDTYDKYKIEASGDKTDSAECIHQSCLLNCYLDSSALFPACSNNNENA